MSDFSISSVSARWILDSRANPTVEAEVVLGSGITSRASVPSGASTGAHEALELRDGGPAFAGKGVKTAVKNVLETIAPALKGKDVRDQQEIDRLLLELDGTIEKKNLGANALLAVSLACAKAAAASQGKPLYLHVNSLLADLSGEAVQINTLVIPMFNVLNGGAHTDWQSTDIQEFMVVPTGASSVQQAVQWGAEIYAALKHILKQNGLTTLIGDEGGFAPLISDEQAMKFIVEAVTKAGYSAGEQVKIAIDAAASEWYKPETQNYFLPKSQKTMTSEDLISQWHQWTMDYPLFSVEDGLAEDDWAHWPALTAQLLERGAQSVGDDLLVTNPARISRAIQEHTCNALIMKINQIGTLTEALTAIDLAHKAGWQVVVSHRSGETEDTAIADIAVGTGSKFLKAGSLARTERGAKYNQLMRIETDYLRINQ